MRHETLLRRIGTGQTFRLPRPDVFDLLGAALDPLTTALDEAERVVGERFDSQTVGG